MSDNILENHTAVEAAMRVREGTEEWLNNLMEEARAHMLAWDMSRQP